ncbi:cytochrome P450 78A5-like [Panicum miliaceum]|uniref:Cytochrome P450 78A5-like n=1 Tax=Panicum miliaceum TaxID=4540 RepID=A0A3L6QMV8_PANMI|nr:cytochrome P450 78A5-like [Panicum miliaceum]
MLALATTHLWIAQLLHRFEWAPAAGGGGVDLSERLNMSLEMATPLASRRQVCDDLPPCMAAASRLLELVSPGRRRKLGVATNGRHRCRRESISDPTTICVRVQVLYFARPSR